MSVNGRMRESEFVRARARVELSAGSTANCAGAACVCGVFVVCFFSARALRFI